ncbi:MAG: cupredoxin domain-containing protein [Candidatus Bipolaricaulia bacterium]
MPIVDLEVSTQAAAGEIVIEMFDFDYTLESLTIPAGTKVRFVNTGQVLHSATADDGSFDTGLLGNGGEATVTFDEVGFFPYYCQLHGTPGGGGMSASITAIDPDAEPPESAEEP